jgi:hypothetical protein
MMNILELQDSAGQYRYRIIRDKTRLMDWQNGQRSIFDVQINAQRIFGQCDRVRMLRLDGTIEHEWDAEKLPALTF